MSAPSPSSSPSPPSFASSYWSRRIPCPHADGSHAIHVLKWTARRPASAPAVVCVHGLTRRGEDFKWLAGELSETRDVYAFSMAGRGESDWTDPALYGYPHYVSDCLHLMDALGLPTADWVGTSMGGLIGVMIASGHAGRIRRLVLNDIGPELSVEALHYLSAHTTANHGKPFATDEEAYAYCQQAYGAFGITGSAAWSDFVEMTLRRDCGQIRLHYDPAIVKPFQDASTFTEPMLMWDLYDRIQSRTLVLHGADSILLTDDIAAGMAARGPRALVVTFSGCGHTPALISGEQTGAVCGFLNAG